MYKGIVETICLPFFFHPHSIVTQIVVISKLNGRKDFILRDFVWDVIGPSKELPVQS